MCFCCASQANFCKEIPLKVEKNKSFIVHTLGLGSQWGCMCLNLIQHQQAILLSMSAWCSSPIFFLSEIQPQCVWPDSEELHFTRTHPPCWASIISQSEDTECISGYGVPGSRSGLRVWGVREKVGLAREVSAWSCTGGYRSSASWVWWK